MGNKNAPCDLASLGAFGVAGGASDIPGWSGWKRFFMADRLEALSHVDRLEALYHASGLSCGELRAAVVG